MARVYNFSAGPSNAARMGLLRRAQEELLDYHGSGQSVMEMSHRSKWFEQILQNAEAAMRRVLGVPDNYKIGFFQGGATQQFAMVPLNFMTTGSADYLVTGNFSKKAAEEAAKFGTARVAASSKDRNFTYIPTSGRSTTTRTRATSTSARTIRFSAPPTPKSRRWRASRLWPT